MRLGRLVIDLHAEAESSIRRLATAAGEIETGGLLLGWWDTGRIVVWQVAEVPDPRATSSSWTRDATRSQSVLERALLEQSHPWLGYVGDWHTHPAACGPSSQDEVSIRRASLGYSHPLLLLVHRSDHRIDGRAAANGRRRSVSIRSINETR